MSSDQSTRADTVAALYDENRVAANRAVLLHAALAAQAGINITDVNCLAVLDKDGPMTAGQLAQWMGLSRGGAITALIDRMEKGGFVRRRRDPDDRRRVIIELVPDGGYDDLRRSLAEFSRCYTTLIDQYNDSELELLLGFARRANEIVHDQTVRLRERSEAVAAQRG